MGVIPVLSCLFCSVRFIVQLYLYNLINKGGTGMLSSTFYSEGKDNFKNNTFSAEEWSAPFMVSPKEIRKRIDSFALCGRKIKRMRLIGLSYIHTRDRIEDSAYQQVKHLPEAERQYRSNYPTIDTDMQFYRCAEIDEPILIGFENGEIFEIDTPQAPEFRMSMNCIPWWIGAGTNDPNIEADILFSPCIGHTIVSVEINTYTTDQDPMTFDFFNEPPFQRELVSNITLRLSNGVGLQIGPCIDYCDVVCVDRDDEWLQLSFRKLKQALFNWEDLHNDEFTGFEAESPTLFWGKKGASYVDCPYITLYSGCKANACLYISDEDFLILDWCISLFMRSWFDEYSDYRFSYKEWYDILDEADRLLSIKSFDTLADEFIARQGKKNYMMWKLNSCGATFWKERNKYTTQIRDIRKWSDLVFAPDDTMNISGF